ncbi:hypothetical protein [Qipengyuania sphaerica]|nr:hypothetical protein [Qipengyuania sphaerica]
MISKTLASFTAVLMTLSVFTGTIATMNYAASQQSAQENIA